MKKIIVLVLSIMLAINFSGCKKNNESDLPYCIAYNLSQIETINDLSDETIKALAILSRTIICEDSVSNFDKNKIDKKILDLVNQTKNEKFSSSSLTKNYYFSNSGSWKFEIKKSEMLENLSNKNIYLSSISKITPIKKENVTTSFDINEKIITFKTINSFCDFKSNNISSVDISDTEISFNGIGLGNIGEGLNLDESEQLSKSGKNYTEILLNFDKDGYIFE